MWREAQKVCVTHFIAIFALLRWSRTKPAVFLRYVCIGLRSFRISCNVVNRKIKFKSGFTRLKNLCETDSILEIIASSRVNIHSFAFQARNLEEASRPCNHLVMSFPLSRWINAGRSYNWWVICSACRSSKIPKVWFIFIHRFLSSASKGCFVIFFTLPSWYSQVNITRTRWFPSHCQSLPLTKLVNTLETLVKCEDYINTITPVSF